MTILRDGRSGLLYTGSLLLIALAGYALHAVPSHVATPLTLWFFLSFPLGSAIGHCTLSDR
jgi:hypothetical protein